MTVGELIEILQKYDPKTRVLGEQYEQRWSGDPNDTDLSDYVATDSLTVSEYEYWTSWANTDPRRADKRRTRCGDVEKCLIIRSRGY